MLGIVLSVGACSKDSGASSATLAPRSTPGLAQVLDAGKKTVVFFLNPNGVPCQNQNQILDKLYADEKGNFSIAYVNALNPADEKAFYDYGIRSLPSLVLVTGKGEIARYFPPGIQSYETLQAALGELK
jgi:thioredoxin 1